VTSAMKLCSYGGTDHKVPSVLQTVRACSVAAGILILAACGGSREEGMAPVFPPLATAASDVSQGEAPLTVHVDASESTDPQKFPLMYEWKFSDGTSATGVAVVHTFQFHGTYTATVVVNDGHHTTTSSPIRIKVTPAPPFVAPTSVSVNFIGIAPSSATGTVTATDREELALTYALATQPAVGTATVDAASGALTYMLPRNTAATSDSFTVKVSNIGGSAVGIVTVALHGNPLVVNQ
jgi:PKD repeat protein